MFRTDSLTDQIESILRSRGLVGFDVNLFSRDDKDDIVHLSLGFNLSKSEPIKDLMERVSSISTFDECDLLRRECKTLEKYKTYYDLCFALKHGERDETR